MLESESRASFEIVVKIILWAKFNIVTSRIRPAGRQLPTPALHGELKLLVVEGSAGVTLMFVGFFYFVLVSNFLGLFPYVFTGASHFFVIPIKEPYFVLSKYSFVARASTLV